MVYDYFPQYWKQEEIDEIEKERIINNLKAGFARTNAYFAGKK